MSQVCLMILVTQANGKNEALGKCKDLNCTKAIHSIWQIDK